MSPTDRPTDQPTSQPTNKSTASQPPPRWLVAQLTGALPDERLVNLFTVGRSHACEHRKSLLCVDGTGPLVIYLEHTMVGLVVVLASRGARSSTSNMSNVFV